MELIPLPKSGQATGANANHKSLIRSRRAAKTVLVYAIAWLLMLWPSLLNRAPFLMPDTTTYVRGADAIAYSLTGHRTAWTPEFFRKYAPEPQEPTGLANEQPTGAGEKEGNDHPIILAGRSAYYGALPYLSYLLGSLWLAVAFQSILTVACIALTLHVLRGFQGRRATNLELLILVGLLALLTPVGYFVGFLMPDITTAFAILATAHILLTWSSMDRPRRSFWILLLVFSLASHSSNLLMTGLAAIAFLALSTIRRREPRQPALMVLLAVLAAIALETAFSLGVREATGASPVRPPFVTARLVDDGPGYRYLRNHCPESGFLLCNYVDRLPQPSDDFLWEQRQGIGVFSALPPAEARALALEQNRFLLAVLADQPLDVAKSSFIAGARQARRTGLEEFNYADGARSHFSGKLPGPLLEKIRRSAAFKGEMPVSLVSGATLPLTVLSLVAIFGAAMTSQARISRLSAFSLVVCLMLVLNTAICGMMSTPHDRYIMRAIWLLPLVAMCLLPPLERVSGRVT